MTEMQAMTNRLVREALDILIEEAAKREWDGMEDVMAARLPELCRDTIVAARLARLRRARAA